MNYNFLIKKVVRVRDCYIVAPQRPWPVTMDINLIEYHSRKYIDSDLEN